MLCKAGLAALLAVLAASPVCAQKWARKMFQTTTHDFGSLARGAKAEYEFVLENIYVKDVHIADVWSSCGCTSVRISNPLLETYQKGAIVASINSRTFLGRQAATITVIIDKPGYARVQLQVTAHVRSDVVFDPPSVQLGTVDQGTPVEKEVAVSCTGCGDWKILDVKSANPHLSGEVLKTVRDRNRASYKLRVRLREDAPPGYLKDHLILVINNRRPIEIPLLVEGRVLAEITASPAALFMGVLQQGEKVTKRLVVRGKRAFRIVSIKCDGNCFNVCTPADDAPKTLHVLPVTFIAGDETGKVVKTVRIETDLDGAATEVSTYAVVEPKQ